MDLHGLRMEVIYQSSAGKVVRLFLSPPFDNHRRLTLLFTVQKQSETRPLICVAGFIHDVSDFMDEHPGGRHLLAKNIGRDATTAFFGGIYDHSNAAHNVCLFSHMFNSTVAHRLFSS